jgi:hypothetical protein
VVIPGDLRQQPFGAVVHQGTFADAFNVHQGIQAGILLGFSHGKIIIGDDKGIFDAALGPPAGLEDDGQLQAAGGDSLRLESRLSSPLVYPGISLQRLRLRCCRLIQ